MPQTHNQRDEIEIVITPPERLGTELAQEFSVRTTLGAITQLVASARLRILIASPFIQHQISDAVNPLVDSLKHALRRVVRLDVISTGEGIENFRAGWSDLFGQGSIRLYQPEPNVSNMAWLGSHAKVLITDSQHAYIGSANFTHPGLICNLEMGVLVHGTIAAKAASFWDHLVEIGFLKEVPPF